MSHHLKQHNTDNEPVSQPNSNASIDICVCVFVIHSFIAMATATASVAVAVTGTIYKYLQVSAIGQTDGRTLGFVAIA